MWFSQLSIIDPDDAQISFNQTALDSWSDFLS